MLKDNGAYNFLSALDTNKIYNCYIHFEISLIYEIKYPFNSQK